MVKGSHIRGVTKKLGHVEGRSERNIKRGHVGGQEYKVINNGGGYRRDHVLV
jgi:hypothetical protein